MIPTSIEEAAQAMRANPRGSLSLQAVRRIVEHNPEDLTVTVETGIAFADLQGALVARKQWLPLDPPGDELTLRDVISFDLSGPRRMGYGTVRDYLIGLTVILADGRIASSGGRVVKNVAGYDMMKLFIGAQDSLGIPVQATFKLLPVPEVEKLYITTQAKNGLETIWNSQTVPVVLDLVRQENDISLVTGFAGTAEDVEWQTKQLGSLHLHPLENLAYANNQARSYVSVPPDRVYEKAQEFRQFIARAGNGVIYTEEAPPRIVAPAAAKLQERLKRTFDPHGNLPALNL